MAMVRWRRVLQKYGGMIFDFSIDLLLILFGALANPILIFVRLGKYLLRWLIKRYARRVHKILFKPDDE